MKRTQIAIAGIAAAAIVGSGAAVLTNSGGTATTTTTVTTAQRCHARGPLPDPLCTPGKTNPQVTQANLAKTICKPGWTATVRPSSSYTNRLKAQQIKAYGYRDTDLHHYEEDHLISLELGGAPRDPRNLWPQYPHSPNEKDQVENGLHKAVCTGRITLASAQRQVASDWTAAGG